MGGEFYWTNFLAFDVCCSWKPFSLPFFFRSIFFQSPWLVSFASLLFSSNASRECKCFHLSAFVESLLDPISKTINAGPISTHLHEMSALFIFSVQCGHLMTYRDVIELTMCQLRLTSSCYNEFIIELSIKADFLSVRSILGFYLNNSTCLLKV